MPNENLVDGSSLRNIYDFMELGHGNSIINNADPGRAHGGEAGMGSSAEQWLDWDDEGNVEFNVPEALAGVIERNPGEANGETPRASFNIDWDQLPDTRYGDVWRTWGINENTRLNNPDLWYEDDNYGRITDDRNVHIDRSLDFIPNMLTQLAMAGMGMGGLLGPMGGVGSSLVNAGRGAINQDWLGAFGSLLGPLGSMADIPGWVTTLARQGINLVNPYKPPRG